MAFRKLFSAFAICFYFTQVLGGVQISTQTPPNRSNRFTKDANLRQNAAANNEINDSTGLMENKNFINDTCALINTLKTVMQSPNSLKATTRFIELSDDYLRGPTSPANVVERTDKLEETLTSRSSLNLAIERWRNTENFVNWIGSNQPYVQRFQTRFISSLNNKQLANKIGQMFELFNTIARTDSNVTYGNFLANIGTKIMKNVMEFGSNINKTKASIIGS